MNQLSVPEVKLLIVNEIRQKQPILESKLFEILKSKINNNDFKNHLQLLISEVIIDFDPNINLSNIDREYYINAESLYLIEKIERQIDIDEKQKLDLKEAKRKVGLFYPLIIGSFISAFISIISTSLSIWNTSQIQDLQKETSTTDKHTSTSILPKNFDSTHVSQNDTLKNKNQ